MTRQMEVGSPLGRLVLVADDQALLALDWPGAPRRPGVTAAKRHPILERAARELRRYLEGKPGPLGVALRPEGTPFQRSVWLRLRGIGPRSLATYASVAADFEAPGAARAVGSAIGRNPLPIFIPCHRVVGSDGRLRGYSGGLERKAALLRSEGLGVDDGRVPIPAVAPAWPLRPPSGPSAKPRPCGCAGGC